MIARGSDSTSLEEVNSLYSDFDVAHKYLGITCVPEVITSPLRDDHNPSLSIFVNSITNSLWFKDFGSGEKEVYMTFLLKCGIFPKIKFIGRYLKICQVLLY